MRAAVVHEVDGVPRVENFPEPVPGAGTHVIEVSMGTVGPTDLMRVTNAAASYYGAFKGPKIVGGEGIGRLSDGRRVYFGHSVAPYGSWAERTIVPEAEVWPIPDDLSDTQILPLGISGTGALIPLEEAKIAAGERVLILGASGPLGQIALQLARFLGAGTVVAAARRQEGLDRLMQSGLADAVVQLGGENDAAALKDAAGEGYDVVLDIVYGAPMVAALKATRRGARIMSIGNQAGKEASVNLQDLVFRTHAGVATGARPASERRAAFERLLGFARQGVISVETATFSLDSAAEAWAAQANGPHAKILVQP